MNISKDNKNILLIIVILLGFLSLFFGAYFGEDTLGGAKNDYLFHPQLDLYQLGHILLPGLFVFF